MCFDNGQIVHATKQSINPEMIDPLLKQGKGEAKEEKKATIQIGGRASSWDFSQEVGPST